jgi:integrase/recombinase XerD
VSALADTADEYLRLRRLLGHNLDEAHRLLPRFVAYLDSINAATVTIEAAIAWATDGVDPATTNGARRIGIARGFARHMAGIDERTEIPPLGLIPMKQQWRPPFLFTPTDIETLLAAASNLRWRLPAATHETLLGLLAVTGMRVGEALRLEPGDIDRDQAVLVIRESKFGKSRLVPVLPDTIAALDRYVENRDRLLRVERTTTRLFSSIRGNELIYPVVQDVFRRLCDTAPIGVGAPHRPRVHDLRHTFAVTTLTGWYRNGDDIEARLPALSTYLGHRDPRSTYWYLSAAPELLAYAARKLGTLPISAEVSR